LLHEKETATLKQNSVIIIIHSTILHYRIHTICAREACNIGYLSYYNLNTDGIAKEKFGKKYHNVLMKQLVRDVASCQTAPVGFAVALVRRRCSLMGCALSNSRRMLDTRAQRRSPYTRHQIRSLMQFARVPSTTSFRRPIAGVTWRRITAEALNTTTTYR
jgi:hypothetical protein